MYAKICVPLFRVVLPNTFYKIHIKKLTPHLPGQLCLLDLEISCRLARYLYPKAIYAGQ